MIGDLVIVVRATCDRLERLAIRMLAPKLNHSLYKQHLISPPAKPGRYLGHPNKEALFDADQLRRQAIAFRADRDVGYA
ncbi:hypothetical protein [Rhizorhabdus argentea]|uniref:hypothetical protein n=1 Tax=Rhizorhabdus argentea TaxID=1387174 RepID=UPI0030EDE6FD